MCEKFFLGLNFAKHVLYYEAKSMWIWRGFLKTILCDRYCTDIHDGLKVMCDYCNASLLNGPLFLQTAQPW